MADLDLERRRRRRGAYNSPEFTVDDPTIPVQYAFTYSGGNIETLTKTMELAGETVIKTYTFVYSGEDITSIEQEVEIV